MELSSSPQVASPSRPASRRRKCASLHQPVALGIANKQVAAVLLSLR
jgi:hypothetical protein